MSKTKEVAVKENTDVVAKEQMPAWLLAKQQANGGVARGSEEVGVEDLTIPRLELVQALSKCRKRTDEANYIAGAEEGMLYNNVTRELYGDRVTVIPVYFKKEFLLWRDSGLGGGFGGAFPNMAEAKAALAEQEAPAEWEIVDTPQHFCLLVAADGSTSEVVLSLSKTKAKHSRKWNSLIRMAGGDSFGMMYTIKGVPDQNDAGQDFYNVSIAPAGYVTMEQFQQAETMYEAVSSGAKTANREIDIDADAQVADSDEY